MSGAHRAEKLDHQRESPADKWTGQVFAQIIRETSPREHGALPGGGHDQNIRYLAKWRNVFFAGGCCPWHRAYQVSEYPKRMPRQTGQVLGTNDPRVPDTEERRATLKQVNARAETVSIIMRIYSPLSFTCQGSDSLVRIHPWAKYSEHWSTPDPALRHWNTG